MMASPKVVNMEEAHKALLHELAEACGRSQCSMIHTLEVMLAYTVNGYMTYAELVGVPPQEAQRMFRETADAVWRVGMKGTVQ